MLLMSPVFLGFVDFFLLCLSFFLLNFINRGGFFLDPMYVKLFFAFIGIWVFVSLSTRKFQISQYGYYWRGMSVLARSCLYTAYCTALLVVVMGLYAYSRFHIFGTCAVLFLMEAAFLTGCFFISKPGELRPDFSVGTLDSSRYRKAFIVIDFFLLGISFFFVNYLKRDGIYLPPDYEKLLLIIYGLWLISSMLTGKFEDKHYRNFYHAVWPWIKSAVLITLGLAFIVYLLRLTNFSRAQVFGPVLLLLCLEIIFYRIYFSAAKTTTSKDVESVDEVKKIITQEKLPLSLDLAELRKFLMEPVRERLREQYLKNDEGLFEFLDASINLSEIVQAEMSLRKSDNMIQYDRMNGHPIRLFINIHKVNDFRWMNRYFLEAHNMLLSGGYYVGVAHTIATHRDWIYEKFPRHLAYVYYAFDFLIHRVFPKLPWIKKVYFTLSKGKNRIISRAELLGRLIFCGFKIIGEKEINKRLYFIAQKTMTPSVDHNPTYGPFVELKRIGVDGKPITVYKLRTMHPYSEYLQDYVYRNNGLKNGGKIQDDFRITGWGKIARKLWLDELPMLYNWIKGDLQLFGVRPLSPHYFNLYPERLRELRKKVIPGLVPPFYVDMPNTFDEICESERCYIEAFQKEPIKTQVSYFCRAFYNIVVKGARSG